METMDTASSLGRGGTRPSSPAVGLGFASATGILGSQRPDGGITNAKCPQVDKAAMSERVYGYPFLRPRRLRKSENVRRLVSETSLDPAKLIMPLFVSESLQEKEEIAEMPGVYRLPVEQVEREVEMAIGKGVHSFMIFGIPSRKDELGSGAYASEGVAQKAIAAIKQAFGESALVFADTCLCEYTSHGHCGFVEGGSVDNDKSLELLAKTAVSQAEAGADFVSPSAMMDGQVKAVRDALDREGFRDTGILAYSAKYASSFYGPFRSAAQSAPKFGDRRGYQMDTGNIREAVKEVELDIREGADIVMVKPAMPYLDVISEVRRRFDHPVAAYQVSGEYAMLRLAGREGYIDERRAILESLTSIRRAGADLIITYFAPEVSDLIRGTGK